MEFLIPWFSLSFSFTLLFLHNHEIASEHLMTAYKCFLSFYLHQAYNSYNVYSRNSSIIALQGILKYIFDSFFPSIYNSSFYFLTFFQYFPLSHSSPITCLLNQTQPWYEKKCVRFTRQPITSHSCNIDFYINLAGKKIVCHLPYLAFNFIMSRIMRSKYFSIFPSGPQRQRSTSLII